VYRKLGVEHRSAAVSRGRKLGLLQFAPLGIVGRSRPRLVASENASH
jgi:hypothetical protein